MDAPSPRFFDLGTHRLYSVESGPPRSARSAAVIIVSGGYQCTVQWVAVQRLVSSFARIYTYDRGGYGSSTLPPGPPSGQNAAKELRLYLEKAHIAPPWILVGHSYGGIIVREFLVAAAEGEVAGMVIVDSSDVWVELPDLGPDMLGDASWNRVIGLDSNRACSAEEYQAIVEADEANEHMSTIETHPVFRESSKVVTAKIAGRQLLGDGRLSVIFGDESSDFRNFYDFAVSNGNGSEQERETLRKFLETYANVEEQGQRAHLSLSSNSRFVKAQGRERAHSVQIVAPDLIAREIRWVLEG